VSDPGGDDSGGQAPPDELSARANAIEEAYEFFLAYASQGLPTESGQIREYIQRFDRAVAGLGAFFIDYVAGRRLDAAPYRAFIDVLDRDARDTHAALEMVLAQRTIPSQTIDNLNANIHVRALLTDLFLIDEILKGGTR
jgi:hypothetical protein